MNENLNQKDNNEIDLVQVSNTIKNGINNIFQIIPSTIKYIKRHFIVLLSLLIIGFGLGVFLNKFTKTYESNITVMPNFETVDFLYEKINLLDSKIAQNDTTFLSKLHLSKENKITNVEVKPITDLYKFLIKEDKYYDIFKTLTENNDAKKIIEESSTSKNFTNHLITISSKKKLTEKEVNEIVKYINTSEHYQRMRVEIRQNLKDKLVANDSIIKQIDNILSKASKEKSGSSVVYSEDSDLSEIISKKLTLIAENHELKVHDYNLEYIITPLDSSINLEKKEGLNIKLHLILPALFIGLFLLFGAVKRVK